MQKFRSPPREAKKSKTVVTLIPEKVATTWRNCPLPKPSGTRIPVAAGSGEREMECTVGSASRQVRLYSYDTAVTRVLRNFPVVALMVLL